MNMGFLQSRNRFCGFLFCLRRAPGQDVHCGGGAGLLVGDVGEGEAHFDARDCAHEHEVVEVAEVADAEDAAFQLAEALAERHVEVFEDDCAECVGVVAFGEEDGREDGAVFAGVEGEDFEAPAADGGAGCLREAVVAGVDLRETFFVEHVERCFQAVEEACRGGVGEVAGLVGGHHLAPVPVGAGHATGLGCGEGFFRDGVESEAWGEHQAFLRARHRDIHAPRVVLEVHGAEAADGVDHEQRGMVGGVDGGADFGDAAGDAGAGLVVDDHDGLDGAGGVGAQAGLDVGGVDAVAPVAGDELDNDAEAVGHGAPEGGELAGFVHEHGVAGLEDVDDGGFPGAGAGAWEDNDGAVGAEHLAHAVEHAAAEQAELGPAVVDGGAVHGAEDAVRHVAGAGDLQEVAAALERPAVMTHLRLRAITIGRVVA